MALMSFKNDDAADLEPFSVVQITGIEKQDDGQYWLTCEKSDNAANFLLAITSYETVKAGKYGLCNPLGQVYLTKYYVSDGTPAHEESWGVDNDRVGVRKNYGGGGHSVLGVDSDESVVLMMHHGKIVLKGKTSASHAAATSQNVEIWAGAVGSEADTGDTVSAYNRGDAIDNDIWVNIERTGSGWEVYPLECG